MESSSRLVWLAALLVICHGSSALVRIEASTNSPSSDVALRRDVNRALDIMQDFFYDIDWVQLERGRVELEKLFTHIQAIWRLFRSTFIGRSASGDGDEPSWLKKVLHDKACGDGYKIIVEQASQALEDLKATKSFFG